MRVLLCCDIDCWSRYSLFVVLVSLLGGSMFEFLLGYLGLFSAEFSDCFICFSRFVSDALFHASIGIMLRCTLVF